MQQPWIQVFVDLPGHRKIIRLRNDLKLKERYEAVGLIVSLWSWAAVHAPDGDLSDQTAQDLADACGWRRSAKGFVEALVAAGFVDREGDTLTLHDWDGYQGMLQESVSRGRRKAAGRQKAYRQRRKMREAAMGRLRELGAADEILASAIAKTVLREALDSAETDALKRSDQGQTVLRELQGDAREGNDRNVTHDVTDFAMSHNGDGSTNTNTNIYLLNKAVVATMYDGVTPDERDQLKLIGGRIGQNILLLSDRQMDDLLDKLGGDGFEAYGQRLVAWIRKTGANVDHYQTILKWWREDMVPTVPEPELLWSGKERA